MTRYIVKSIALLSALVVINSCGGGSSSNKENSNHGLINHPPVANSENIESQDSKSISIVLNATDKDSDRLSYIITKEPKNGVLKGKAPNLVYIPNRGFSGKDSFSYIVSDGKEKSKEAEVVIYVKSSNATKDNNNSSSSNKDTNTTNKNNNTNKDNNSTKNNNSNNNNKDSKKSKKDKNITIKRIKLHITKTTLNKDTNTTIKVEALYNNNKKEDITTKVKWIIKPNDAIVIKKNTLIAKKDSNVTLQAKYNNTISNKVELTIYWEVDGHRLPPEPDPKVNNSTLLGIDSNNNGVRDDVERWIYNKYKDKHPIYIDIAMQEARADRLILEKQPKTKAEAMEIKDKVDAPIDCQAYYRYEAKYFNEPILVKEDIANEYFRNKIYFNTKERMAIYEQYDRLLSGDSYTLLDGKEMKKACEFNTSKYDKE